MKSYYCRICWNTANWQQPSGDACWIETGNSYAHQIGFGHEEWLFRLSWLIQGFHYSFIQPLNKIKTRKDIGTESFHVILYANSGTEKLFIGDISNCQLVDSQEAKDIYSQYQKNGWAQEIKKHIRNVATNLQLKKFHFMDNPLPHVKPEFNIKFRAEELMVFKPYISIPSNHPLNKRHYYQPYRVDNSGDETVETHLKKKREWFTRHIDQQSPKERPHVHNQIQNSLYRFLELKGFNPVMERDYIDMQAQKNGLKFLFEVKSYQAARECVRVSLGQMLEYAHIPEKSFNHLCIVGNAEAVEAEKNYIRFLVDNYQLPISYICIATESSVINFKGSLMQPEVSAAMQ
jgi:hypothetical protein